jgi:uncharacterized OB-fold protein
VLIYRCESCGVASVVPRRRCPRCRGRFQTRDESPVGTVLSWTILRVPAEGFGDEVGIAHVGLDGGANALANFDPARPPEIGLRVSLAVGEDGRRRLR